MWGLDNDNDNDDNDVRRGGSVDDAGGANPPPLSPSKRAGLAQQGL